MEIKISGYEILLSESELEILLTRHYKVFIQACEYGFERSNNPYDDGYYAKLYHQPKWIVDELQEYIS